MAYEGAPASGKSAVEGVEITEGPGKSTEEGADRDIAPRSYDHRAKVLLPPLAKRVRVRSHVLA